MIKFCATVGLFFVLFFVTSVFGVIVGYCKDRDFEAGLTWSWLFTLVIATASTYSALFT